MKSTRLLLPFLGILSACPLEAATQVITTSEAFATSNWAFGAPYRRDSWSGGELGISNSDPFQMAEGYAADGDPNQYQWNLKVWQETTYLVFNSGSFGGASSVDSAVLSLATLGRSGIPADLLEGMVISAHSLLEDPTKILYTSANPNAAAYTPGSPSYDPSLDYAYNYGSFQTNYLGNVAATFTHGADFGLYELDLTDLVNGWLADPNAPGAFALALTGTAAGNDPDAWLAIAAAGGEGAPYLTVATVPEPASALLIAMGSLVCVVGRRRK